MKKTYDDYECLLVEREDRLATVTLNRPEHRNAINHQLVFDTSMALEMATFQTEDHCEAVSAFLEKRTPRFTGR
jgi:enoyl-CoA hydratase/carnithine racemase